MIWVIILNCLGVSSSNTDTDFICLALQSYQEDGEGKAHFSCLATLVILGRSQHAHWTKDMWLFHKERTSFLPLSESRTHLLEEQMLLCLSLLCGNPAHTPSVPSQCLCWTRTENKSKWHNEQTDYGLRRSCLPLQQKHLKGAACDSEIQRGWKEALLEEEYSFLWQQFSTARNGRQQLPMVLDPRT